MHFLDTIKHSKLKSLIGSSFASVTIICFIHVITSPKVNYMTTDINMYNKRDFGLMSDVERRSLRSFSIGAGLFISATVVSTAGYVASVTCNSGVLTTVFGNLAGLGVCIASTAVFLVTGAITAGLSSPDAENIAGAGSQAKRSIERYHKANVLGTGILFDRSGTDAASHESFGNRSISYLHDLGYQDIKVHNNIVLETNTTVHTISYSYDGTTSIGLSYDGNITNYFDTEFGSNANKFSKRSTNENKATFSVGSKYSQTEAEEEGNAKEDEKAGDRKDALSDYFGHKPRTHYCIQVGNGKSKFMKGEFHSNGKGGMNKQCLGNI